MASQPATFTGEEIVFEKIRSYVTHATDLGAAVAGSLELREWEEPILRQMVRQLSAEMLARKLVRDHYSTTRGVDVPATWWQHLKDDHAPGWLKKRWPVRHKSIKVDLHIDFTRYATYPEADVVLPERFGKAVIFEKIGVSTNTGPF